MNHLCHSVATSPTEIGREVALASPPGPPQEATTRRDKSSWSQGLSTIIMGEPGKGSHERAVGSWLTARGHLEKTKAGLGTGDFFLRTELYRPFLQREEDCTNTSRNQFYNETSEKGKDKIKSITFPKILLDFQFS